MTDDAMTWEGLCPLGPECPFPSDPDWHVPHCGHGLEGHHHHWPPRSRGGKEIVAFLCPRCHDKVHRGPWGDAVLDIPGIGKVYRIWWVKDNKTVLERIIEAAPGGQVSSPQDQVSKHPDRVVAIPLPAVKVALESVPDEHLAALFAEADKRQAEGFLLKCRIVHTFRERHVQAWGESWLENAYELFHVSRRTLEVYARLHEILGASANYLVEAIGPLTESRSLMRHIGRKTLEDGKVALEAAVTHVAEYGEPPTVAALEHRLGEEGAEIKQDPECPESDTGRHQWECRICKKEK